MSAPVPRTHIKKSWAIVVTIAGSSVLLGSIFYLISLAGGPTNPSQLWWIVSGFGIISFFGVLAISNLLSEDFSLNHNAVRRALTASIIIVYLTIVSMAVTDMISVTDGSIEQKLIDNFALVVITIIGFYFGGRAAPDIINAWRRQA